MESNLTKRRPSIVPGYLPDLSNIRAPSVETVKEEEDRSKKYSSSTFIESLPSITNYETKPYLTIRKLQYENPPTGRTTHTSMAHTHGICVLNTEAEEIIACDHYNNRLLMFDSNDNGKLLQIFRGDLATPECVTPRPNYRQQIYVTKAHSICLYDLEKKTFIQKLGIEESGHANNRFNSPTGIVVDPDNGYLNLILVERTTPSMIFLLARFTCVIRGIIESACFRQIFVMLIVDGI